MYSYVTYTAFSSISSRVKLFFGGGGGGGGEGGGGGQMLRKKNASNVCG